MTTRARAAAAPLLLVTLLLLAAGCAYVPTASLDYRPVAIDAARTDLSLVVLPFEDARPPRLYPGLQGHLFKTYIPLVPYVKVPYERLDESHADHQAKRRDDRIPSEHFTTAMAKSVADDFAASGMFERAEFAREPGDADLILTGTLRSTEFDIYASSYMLGAPGVLLWLLPVPIGRDSAEVKIDLALHDRAGQEIWTHALEGSSSKLFTFYNSAGASTSSQFRMSIKRYGSNDKGIDGKSLWAYHADALRSGMGEAKRALASALASAPVAGQPDPE